MQATREKADLVYRKLNLLHPNARIELDFSNPLELLVATVLSAQCTDKRVNMVTRELFKKYRQPQDYLAAPEEEFANDIRSTGFFRTKARNIRAAMQKILSDYNGKVPDTIESLTLLPGVGRKTANILLANLLGTPAIAVDTHVSRVSRRLGLTQNTDPDKIEADLARLFDRKRWSSLNRIMVFHGRYICQARRPLCEKCSLQDLCPFFASGAEPKSGR